MKKIDLDWLKKFQSKVNKLNRSVPVGSTESRCQKEIFVQRMFRWINGKAFKLKVKDEVYYALFFKRNRRQVPSNKALYSYTGITFYLGWSSSEYEIDFFNEKARHTELKLYYNDILNIEYEEISIEKYMEVVNLFA